MGKYRNEQLVGSAGGGGVSVYTDHCINTDLDKTSGPHRNQAMVLKWLWYELRVRISTQ